jgi:hypothetical protein
MIGIEGEFRRDEHGRETPKPQFVPVAAPAESKASDIRLFIRRPARNPSERKGNLLIPVRAAAQRVLNPWKSTDRLTESVRLAERMGFEPMIRL